MVVLDVPCGFEVHCLSEMQVVSWPAWPPKVKVIWKDTPNPQNVKVMRKDPHLKKHVKQIEGVQRRATCIIKNCYTQEPETVTNLLNKLTWIPLKVQRTINLIPQSNSWW